MSGNYFLDTNILVYSFETSEKGQIAKDLIRSGISSNKGNISYQVVQEFINVATRKFKVPMIASDLRTYMQRVLIPLWSVYSSPTLMNIALDVQERWQFGFYDSLIVASALEASCDVLFSEDLQHGQKIYETEIINPFL